MQGGSANVWKENVIEELEAGEMEYETVEKFLTVLKREFGGGEKELVKAAELKKLKQGEKTMEEFVQEFKRAARGSGYEGRPLIEEFKRGMNGEIRRKLMEAENPPVLWQPLDTMSNDFTNESITGLEYQVGNSQENSTKSLC